MCLAARMIRLSGYDVKDEANPNGDIAIEFTGLRPGEKLYEELLIGENVRQTAHPRIMAADEVYLSWPEMASLLQQLEAMCDSFAVQQIIELLRCAPTGFNYPGNSSDLLLQCTVDTAKQADNSVVNLQNVALTAVGSAAPAAMAVEQSAAVVKKLC